MTYSVFYSFVFGTQVVVILSCPPSDPLHLFSLSVAILFVYFTGLVTYCHYLVYRFYILFVNHIRFVIRTNLLHK